MKNLSALFLAISPSLISSGVQAGAWLQNEGEGEVIGTVRFYTAKSYFDENGHRTSIPLFTKSELAAYFEYGLRPYLTLGGEVDLAGVSNEAPQFTDPFKIKPSYGSIFARTYLYQGNDYVVSIEPGITFPRTLGNELTPDGEKLIPELKLNFGYGFEAQDQHHFIDASLKYRHRNDNNLDDMLKAELSLGYRFNDRIMGLAQISQEKNLGSIANTPGNYDLTKPQLSVLYDHDYFASQVGVFADLYGKNTGAGYGLLYSVWYKF